MEQVTIKQLQNIYLGMIEEFHDFCTKNSLTYYMVGGTLLGAVREKGFIPWDDDVDFAMPRPDYEKFIRIFPKSKKSGLLLGSYNRYKNYVYPYAKLLNSKIPFVSVYDEKYSISNAINSVHFDVYPIDGLGNNVKTAHKKIKKFKFIRKIWFIKFSEQKSKNLLKNFIIKLISIFPSRFYVKLLDRAMRNCKYEKSELVTRWRGGNDNIVPKKWFDKPVELQFENLKLFAPSNYDDYLKSIYGDYNRPRRENEGGRHDISKLSYVSMSKLMKMYDMEM